MPAEGGKAQGKTAYPLTAFWSPGKPWLPWETPSRLGCKAQQENEEVVFGHGLVSFQRKSYH